MKKLLIAALACTALAIYSCSKNAAPAPILTNVTGTWQYVGYSGGLAGFKFTPQAIANYLQIDTAGYRILFNSGDSGQNCSTFTYAPFENSYDGILTLHDNIFGPGYSFGNTYNVTLLHDTIALYPTNCMDCTTAYYKAVDKHFNWCAAVPGQNH